MPEPIQLAIPVPHLAHPEEPAPAPPRDATIAPLALVDVTVPLSELAGNCADKLLGIAAAVAGMDRNPVGAGLSLTKAGWELAECSDEETHKASVQETIIECTNRGGMPVGVLENSVSCQGMKP